MPQTASVIWTEAVCQHVERLTYRFYGGLWQPGRFATVLAFATPWVPDERPRAGLVGAAAPAESAGHLALAV